MLEKTSKKCFKSLGSLFKPKTKENFLKFIKKWKKLKSSRFYPKILA